MHPKNTMLPFLCHTTGSGGSRIWELRGTEVGQASGNESGGWKELGPI